MKKPAITVRYVLVCDDVRVEDNGKGLIVGLYNDAIVLPAGTDQLVSPLTFYINMLLPKAKSIPVVTWLEGPNRQRMQESDFGMVTGTDQVDLAGVLVWRIVPWKSEGLGTYKLHMTQGGHDSVIHEFVVRN